MRLIRLMVASLLLPAAAYVALQIAIHFDGDTSTIDTAGNLVGIAVLVASLLAISRFADDKEWIQRVGTVIGLGIAYFGLTWGIYGDPGRSIDEAPHLVWLGTSLVAFSPAIVIMPAVRWAWSEFLLTRTSTVL